MNFAGLCSALDSVSFNAVTSVDANYKSEIAKPFAWKLLLYCRYLYLYIGPTLPYVPFPASGYVRSLCLTLRCSRVWTACSKDLLFKINCECKQEFYKLLKDGKKILSSRLIQFSVDKLYSDFILNPVSVSNRHPGNNAQPAS
jgi:hypothetical protein